MTLKKSEIQALLDSLPDEFEAELFHAGIALLTEEEEAPFELSKEQWQKVYEATEELKAGKGISSAELKKRMAQVDVPEWQIDAAAEAARDVRENGGHTMEEFKARAEAWIQEKA